jgi:hypothetical protein
MTIKFKILNKLEEFSRDYKRFPSLEEDLSTFIDAQLFSYHKLGVDNKGIERIPNLEFEHPPVYKATKFACKALKGKGARSGIRVIYAYIESLEKIHLIEIYYKEKDNTKENKERIKKNYEKIAK